MNEHAKKWVAALRSDEYEQTRGHLRDDVGYCCLGVLCDVYRKEAGEGEWDGHVFTLGVGRFDTHPPQAVVEWVGLRTATGRANEGLALTDRNDYGATLSEIADVLAAEPAGLLT